MRALTTDVLRELLKGDEPPCISLYQPTHRANPDSLQDPIRYKNLVRDAERSLREKYSGREVRPLLERFQELADDRHFWTHQRDGLAVLGSAGTFEVFQFQRPVPELAVVADSFHVKPLLRIVQSADRFQVLGLNRQAIRLFEGNRDVLDEIEPSPAIQQAISGVLEADLKEPHVEVWTHSSGSSGEGVRHGSGSRADEVDSTTDRFFRAADRAVLEHYSRPSGQPLLLAALPEHHAHFRRISRNPFLLADGIEIHPDDLPIEALRERAWRAIEPHYLARLAGLVDMFGAARSRELGSADLAQVAKGAASGRVATLLIEAERHVPGRLDPATGAIEFDDLANPEVDDLLDDLAEAVLRTGGEVVVVPAERMPTATGLAATFRH
jgi:hypothetical protein